MEAHSPRTSPGVSDRAGRFIRESSGSEEFYAFDPKPLPPEPALEIDAELQGLLDRANQALGRLDGVTLLLPDPGQFLYTYIRKEAVLSSQIEGTQSSLSDLLLFEHKVSPDVPREDIQETRNYIDAVNHGLVEMAEGRPLSLRLLHECHCRLLRDGRGSDAAPGEFRRVQNWVGGTRPATARYVPPSADKVAPAMGHLEKFLHNDPVATPILVKAALAHAQFETIHPYLDGNGRVGRLLITLLLAEEQEGSREKVLSRPLLYLSFYLKQYRDAYYEHLQRIRTHGEWEPWLRFFLEGVVEVAALATETTQRIVGMVARDRQRLHELGRGAGSAGLLFDQLVKTIVTTVPEATAALPITEPTVGSAMRNLVQLGIVREIEGRPRIYVYDEYLAVLNAGTERAQ